MKKPSVARTRFLNVLAWITLIVVVVIFGLGAWQVLKFLYSLVAVPIAAQIAGAVWGFVKSVFVDHLDGWLTAVATTFLAYFTFTLRKEAQRQAEKDKPLLAIGLAQDPQPGTREEPYLFFQEDASDTRLAAYQKNQDPLFVRINLKNEQTTVTGIAVKVSVRMELLFGVNDNVTAYPYKIERTIAAPVIGADKFVSGATFNVAGLPNYSVVIKGISYEDMNGETRQIGHGVGSIYKRVGEEPRGTVVVFQ